MMASDFLASYELCRGRFDQEIGGLTDEQLRFRLYPGSLSIGEMALHLAGVEIWFAHQIDGREVPENLSRIVKCATEGVVNDAPFPYALDEIDGELVAESLAAAYGMVVEILSSPTPQRVERSIQSALGPVIDGYGAMARFAFHPAYHHGQAYQIMQSPGFPGE